MRKILLLFVLILVSSFVSAATLHGSIYDETLEVESDVLLELNGQKYLSKDGTYTFEISPGTYTLTARKGDTSIQEKVEITKEGSFLFDVFLLGDLADEEELWQETTEDYLGEDPLQPTTGYATWRYWVGGIIIVLLLWRLVRIRKKYGPLRKFRKKMKVEHKKTIEQHKKEIAKEPGYLEKTLEIIKKHDGRISQKQLRKEMLHLSEAKVSLILTELEHKGKIEKVKKGRGNVILLKNDP